MKMRKLAGLVAAFACCAAAAKGWQCDVSTDKITDQKKVTAKAEANYIGGGWAGLLMAVDAGDPSAGYLLAVVGRGIIDCTRGTFCSFRVKVNGAAETFSVQAVRSDIVLIKGYETRRMVEARQLRIEVPIYNKGPIYMDFELDAPSTKCAAPAPPEDPSSSPG